jgi:N-acetylglucosamine malate deacetylase 1
MEDHQNTCRLLVTSAFAHGMPNFLTEPPREHYEGSVAIYHALPHGLHDGLGKPIKPDAFVKIDSVLSIKREMLAQHTSQKEWLDVSQGMDAYLKEMEDLSREMGCMSKKFKFAEAWRRHSHLGFSAKGFDPLKELLGKACM